MDTARTQERLRDFAAARDWEQFHSPKNLVMALGAEVGELADLFQWKTEEQSRQLVADSADMARVREEVADVMIYLLRLADALKIDLQHAVDAKVALNEEKYPVQLSHGKVTKYNRR